MDINLTSVLLMCKYAIPAMVANGGGSIVNISSIGAIRGFGSTGYAASKGGMLSLGTSMAYAHGVMVSASTQSSPGTFPPPWALRPLMKRN